MTTRSDRSLLIEAYSDDARSDPRRERDDAPMPRPSLERHALRDDPHARTTSFPPPASPASANELLALRRNSAERKRAERLSPMPGGRSGSLGRASDPNSIPGAESLQHAIIAPQPRDGSEATGMPNAAPLAAPLSTARGDSVPPSYAGAGRLGAGYSSPNYGAANPVAPNQARSGTSDAPPSSNLGGQRGGTLVNRQTAGGFAGHREAAASTREGSMPRIPQANVPAFGQRRSSMPPEDVERVSQLRREVAQLRIELASLQRQLGEQAGERADEDAAMEDLRAAAQDVDWLRQALDESLAVREAQSQTVAQLEAQMGVRQVALDAALAELPALRTQVTEQLQLSADAASARAELEGGLVATARDRDAAVAARDALAVEVEMLELRASRTERELVKTKADFIESSSALGKVEGALESARELATTSQAKAAADLEELRDKLAEQVRALAEAEATGALQRAGLQQRVDQLSAELEAIAIRYADADRIGREAQTAARKSAEDVKELEAVLADEMQKRTTDRDAFAKVESDLALASAARDAERGALNAELVQKAAEIVLQTSLAAQLRERETELATANQQLQTSLAQTKLRLTQASAAQQTHANHAQAQHAELQAKLEAAQAQHASQTEQLAERESLLQAAREASAASELAANELRAAQRILDARVLALEAERAQQGEALRGLRTRADTAQAKQVALLVQAQAAWQQTSSALESMRLLVLENEAAGDDADQVTATGSAEYSAVQAAVQAAVPEATQAIEAPKSLEQTAENAACEPPVATASRASEAPALIAADVDSAFASLTELAEADKRAN